MAETGEVTGASAGTNTGETGDAVGNRASGAVGSRVGAYLVDFALLAAVSFGLFVVTMVGVVGVAMGASGGTSDGAMMAAGLAGTVAYFVMWALIGVIVFGYFTFMDASDGTLGKRLLDVSVVTGDGSPATRRDTAIRTAILMVPFPVMALLGTLLGGIGFVLGLFLMAGWLLVEAVVMAISDDGQRLGDRAAGTYVVPE